VCVSCFEEPADHDLEPSCFKEASSLMTGIVAVAAARLLGVRRLDNCDPPRCRVTPPGAREVA
jgi:hypothetical protein